MHGWHFWRNYPVAILKILIGTHADMPARRHENDEFGRNY
jgi:hypothetical protein